MTVKLSPLSLIVGGAASGKSVFAEQMVEKTGQNLVYIATAQAYDTEMEEKISAHQQRRGDGWRTLNAPFNIGEAVQSVGLDEIVLLDCATMWLSNLLLADHDVNQAFDTFFQALEGCVAPVVIVSNEVGYSVVPENALARRFRQMQGELNQRLALHAGTVVTVIAGLPLALKGDISWLTP